MKIGSNYYKHMIFHKNSWVVFFKNVWVSSFVIKVSGYTRINTMSTLRWLVLSLTIIWLLYLLIVLVHQTLSISRWFIISVFFLDFWVLIDIWSDLTLTLHGISQIFCFLESLLLGPKLSVDLCVPSHEIDWNHQDLVVDQCTDW